MAECTCHLGSAATCPIHTQEDYEAADRKRAMAGGEDQLMEQMRNAVKDPRLVIRFDRNLFGGGGVLMYLEKPGPTPRSKPIKLLSHVIVGDPGQKQSDLLRIVAEVMAEEGN